MVAKKQVALLGALLHCLFFASTLMASHKYTIDLVPKHIGANEVTVELSTDIPGSIDVMLGLRLEEQRANDVFIGDSKRVSLKNGHAVATVGKKGLPSGRYILEVTYYPKWGPQDAISKGSGAGSKIESQHIVTLVGSGASATGAETKENGQRWVMENVYGGTQWSMPTWTEKFGPSDPVDVTLLNPDIIKAHYFEQIDMTIFVNALKGEVSHWRVGRQSH